MQKTISNQIILLTSSGKSICIMSGAEIIYRDSKQRTIVVWGDVVNMSSGLGRRMMFEIPQGVIKYETTKPEIFERLAIDNYKIIFVNGCLSP